MNLPVIVIGGGGHAKVLISALRLQQRLILGFVDRSGTSLPVLGVSNLGNDEAAFAHLPAEVELVNGVGSVGSTRLRIEVFERFKQKGYRFASVLHPAALIAAEVELAEGVQVMAGAVIQAGARLAENVIVNTGACVDHDCWIEPHTHIAPGATLSGNVRVGFGSLIGTGASVIQNVRIGSRSIVGAGAVVVKDVPEGVTVVGVPAAVRKSSQCAG